MLTDADLMPFGKHKGTPLGQIPESYWYWFLQQKWAGYHHMLRDYAHRQCPYVEVSLTEEEKPKPPYVPGPVTHPEIPAPWEE
jgi:hypothetical protein